MMFVGLLPPMQKWRQCPHAYVRPAGGGTRPPPTGRTAPCIPASYAHADFVSL